jgi:hypothetical protein
LLHTCWTGDWVLSIPGFGSSNVHGNPRCLLFRAICAFAPRVVFLCSRLDHGQADAERACERITTAGRERAPFFDTGNAAAASCLPNQTAHAPEQGGTGGQQSSVRRRLLRKSTVNGSMVRGPRPQSMVRWRVFDHCVAPVAWCLGSHLAGYRLPGIRLPAIALLIKTPRALRHQRPMSRRARRKGQPGSNRSGRST